MVGSRHPLLVRDIGGKMQSPVCMGKRGTKFSKRGLNMAGGDFSESLPCKPICLNGEFERFYGSIFSSQTSETRPQYFSYGTQLTDNKKNSLTCMLG